MPIIFIKPSILVQYLFKLIKTHERSSFFIRDKKNQKIKR